MNLRGFAGIVALVALVGIAQATNIRLRTSQLRGPDFGRKNNLATPAESNKPTPSNPPQQAAGDIVKSSKQQAPDPPLTGALAEEIADSQAVFAAYWDERDIKTSDCPANCYGVNGKCLQGKCVCKTGWQGEDCHIKDPKHDATARMNLFNRGSQTSTPTATPAPPTEDDDLKDLSDEEKPAGKSEGAPKSAAKSAAKSEGSAKSAALPKTKTSLRGALSARDDFEAVLDEEQEDEVRKLAARLFSSLA